MTECLCLLFVALHFTAGCILSGVDKTRKVKGHIGGSVLLSCSCTDLQTRTQSFTWWTQSSGTWTDVFSDERYRGRVQRFNELSPGNQSLLITDLRKEDERDYRCESEHRYYRDFTLRVSDVSPGPPTSPFPTSSPDLLTNHNFQLGLTFVYSNPL
ncbi:uncharacterized protein LOC143522407 [Brachyhypopomus gauderio]|uniref:uncharacterized protein LOC143522407 n=1 Tax=Brachyhypopomus gauderio TaxID=698409 RepID=UPI004041E190